jgi:hypothetical protein
VENLSVIHKFNQVLGQGEMNSAELAAELTAAVSARAATARTTTTTTSVVDDAKSAYSDMLMCAVCERQLTALAEFDAKETASKFVEAPAGQLFRRRCSTDNIISTPSPSKTSATKTKTISPVHKAAQHVQTFAGTYKGQAYPALQRRMTFSAPADDLSIRYL